MSNTWKWNILLCSCDSVTVCILHRLMKAFQKAEPCFRIVYSKLTQTYLWLFLFLHCQFGIPINFLQIVWTLSNSFHASLNPHISFSYMIFNSCAIAYTVRSKSFRTDFSKIEDKWGRHMYFLIQNKLHWRMYRLLRRRTISEKLPKISPFWPSLIHHLRLLGTQQHPQSRILLTSFSTWGTENSLAEINLESTRGDEGL